MPPYIPHTPDDIRQMLAQIGLPDVEALFADIPAPVRLGRPLDLGAGMTEWQLTQHLTAMSQRNTGTGAAAPFLGAGVYDSFIPAAVDALASRQEFFTAYTPYQPEISQGTLQALFEYQTLICEWTGMDVANASVYDGASAVSEAVRMAMAQTRSRHILLSAALHPGVAAAIRPLLEAAGATLHWLPMLGLATDHKTAAALLASPPDGGWAAVVVQSPNFLGVVEDMAAFSAAAASAGALSIQCIMDALSLAVLSTPGESGVDIAAGSGQGLGGGLSFGGPYFGFMTTRDKLTRRLPGRIVGQSRDVDGKRAFVLTLQAREQHIRRDKATSNICSNHSLYALRAAIYMALMGPAGLRDAAAAAMRNARALRQGLLSTGLFEPVGEQPWFREFALRPRVAGDELRRKWRAAGFLPGYDLARLAPGDCPGLPRDAMLFCATEKNTEEQIARFVHALTAPGGAI